MKGEVETTKLIKFVARGTDDSTLRWLRQFPGREPVWNGCRFSFDRELKEYDWLVAYDDLPSRKDSFFRGISEKLACPKESTLLITTEPSSVKLYGASFLKQFGNILTSQESHVIDLPSAIRSQPALRWYYGISKSSARDYDALKSAPRPTKDLMISTVCSSKQQAHTLHKKRYDFVQWLRGKIPELEVYGHGVRDIADKAEAIDPYRYHIAIENHICRHHWTEKLSDCFLGWSVPIYCGCPNAGDYFPEDSIIRIDIGKPDDALEIIRSAVTGDDFERRLPAVAEARRLVLEEYNLFAVISRIVRERDALDVPNEPGKHMIHSRHALRRKRMMLPLIELAIEKRRYQRNIRASGAPHKPEAQ